MAIDLDAARAARREAKGDGPVVKLDGKDYQMPPELPYEALEYMRGLNDPETAAGALVDVTRTLLGKHYEKVKSNMTFDDLEVFVQGAMEEYGVVSPLDSSTS